MFGAGLVARFESQGLALRVHGGRLQVLERRRGVKEKLLPEVLAHRKQLIEELAGPQEARPRISERGDLVIPMNAAARYRWWDGGQSIDETLRELGVSRAVWERYTDQPFEG